jgi:hypothetical protein
MAVIDSDAHVLETERTWDYMLESERLLKPRIVPTPNDPTSGGESWLIDETYLGKARNVGHDTSRESREMDDILRLLFVGLDFRLGLRRLLWRRENDRHRLHHLAQRFVNHLWRP